MLRSLLLAACLLGATSPASAAPWPRFAIYGWLSPPPRLTDSLHIADYARAGFNVLLPAWQDSGIVEDTRRRLDLAQANGLVAIAWDRRLRAVNPDDPATHAILDSVVATWRDHPAFLAYYLGDEPTHERITLVAKFFALLRARDPEHPGWNNLPGRAGFASHAAFMDYTRHYVAAVRPWVLSNDHYDLLENGAFGQLTENVRGLGEVARESGLPFWGIILATKHGPFREPDEGELRWQIGTWLAYGARGIGWFTYWTPTGDSTFHPALVDTGGKPTPAWDRARRINFDTRAIGEVLAGAAWRSAQYAGSLPPYGEPFTPDDELARVEGRALVGRFAGPPGGALVLVANQDSAQARTIVLVPARVGHRAEVFDPATWAFRAASRRPDGGIELALAPGEFALVRLSPGPPAPRPGALALDLWPSPARGSLHLGARGATPGARLTIHDARGRLVRALGDPADGSTRTWDGVRADGGPAAPGLYFVRLESAGESTTRRFLWFP